MQERVHMLLVTQGIPLSCFLNSYTYMLLNAMCTMHITCAANWQRQGMLILVQDMQAIQGNLYS